jgi:phospholipid N-methyltransferase
MRDGDRLELVERNAEFVARLRARLADDDAYQPLAERITLRQAGVEDLADDDHYDVIISGLPLNNFSVEFVSRVLAKFRRLLAPGGTLSFFEYIAVRRAKAALSRQAECQRLREIGRLLGDFLNGREIRRDSVWANVPPAWVHHVRW